MVAIATSTKRKDAGRIAGPLVIATCIEVDLVWTLAGGKQVKNVLHGTVAPGFNATAAVAQAIYAAIIASASWTAYKAYVNAAASFAGVNLRDLRNANMPLVSSTGASTPGTGAGLALANGVSACITLRTATAGRGGRGRVYLPGLDSTAMNAGTGNFSAAFQTAAQNFVTAVETAMTGQSVTHALAGPARATFMGTSGTVHAARPAAPLPVTSILMRLLTPTSQRRRSYVA